MSQIDDAVAEIHRRYVIVDAHRDVYEQIHLRNLGQKMPIHDSMIPRLRRGGVDVVFYAIGGDTLAHSNGTDCPLRSTLENLDAFYEEVERAGSEMAFVRAAEDLPHGGPTGRIHFLLNLEGGMPLEGNVCNLRIFYRLGVRAIQPTWNVRNALGEGVRERKSGSGLSLFGVEVVCEAQRLGMLVDVSHLSPQGVDDVLEVATRPVIATHSNAAALLDHPRNLTDERIRGIAATGGVVGAHFAPAYIDRTSNSPERLADHIDHLVSVAGIEHVGIGPDFVKSDGPRPAREKLFAGVHERYLEELEEIDQLPTLTAVLLRRRYKAEDVARIYGGNFMRVAAEVLGPAAGQLR